jgi:hypothetical protein
MKHFVLLIVVLAALCGCSDSPKQRALEKRLAALEHRVQTLAEITITFHSTNATNWESLMVASEARDQAQARLNGHYEKRLILLEERLDGFPELVRAEIDEELKRRVAAAKQPGQAAPARAAARPAAEATREGVPLSVYNQIAADAAKLLPGQYGLQEVQIKMEIEAFRKLHPSR